MSDRFVLIPKSRLPLPARCWCCGAIDRDCLDFGSNLQWEGAVLLCVHCVREAFSVLPEIEDTEKIAAIRRVQAYDHLIGTLRDELDTVVTRFDDRTRLANPDFYVSRDESVDSESATTTSESNSVDRFAEIFGKAK